MCLHRFCLQHHIHLQWSVPVILAFQRRRQQDHKVKVILEQDGKILYYCCENGNEQLYEFSVALDEEEPLSHLAVYLLFETLSLSGIGGVGCSSSIGRVGCFCLFL